MLNHLQHAPLSERASFKRGIERVHEEHDAAGGDAGVGRPQVRSGTHWQSGEDLLYLLVLNGTRGCAFTYPLQAHVFKRTFTPVLKDLDLVTLEIRDWLQV